MAVINLGGSLFFCAALTAEAAAVVLLILAVISISVTIAKYAGREIRKQRQHHRVRLSFSGLLIRAVGGHFKLHGRFSI